jgi:hypothetical protein
MTLARAIVRLFSTTIPDSSGLRIEFQDGRAGVPVMGDPRTGGARMTRPDLPKGCARIVPPIKRGIESTGKSGTSPELVGGWLTGSLDWGPPERE